MMEILVATTSGETSFAYEIPSVKGPHQVCSTGTVPVTYRELKDPFLVDCLDFYNVPVLPSLLQFPAWKKAIMYSALFINHLFITVPKIHFSFLQVCYLEPLES
jgi:hypothetical protein